MDVSFNLTDFSKKGQKRHNSSNKSLIPAPKSDGPGNKNKLEEKEGLYKIYRDDSLQVADRARTPLFIFSLNVWLDQTFNEIKKILRFWLAPNSQPKTNGNFLPVVLYRGETRQLFDYCYVFTMYQVEFHLIFSVKKASLES